MKGGRSNDIALARDSNDGVKGGRDKDVIDLFAFNVASVVSLSMSRVGQGVLIDPGGGGVIKIKNVSVAQLTDADFIF